MNRKEHLLTILGEEGVEVSQRCAKALRFGIFERQPGQPLTNSERLRDEFIDALTLYRMCVEEGLVEPITDADLPAMEAKRQKVERFLVYSAQQGCLQE